MQQEYLQYMHKDGTLICYNVKPSFILGAIDKRRLLKGGGRGQKS